MDKLDEQFLREVIGYRMEVHYKRICNAKSYSERKQELEYLDEMENKYQEVTNSLSKEQKKIIREYVDYITDRVADETDTYYHCGFEDGMKLMGAFIKYCIK